MILVCSLLLGSISASAASASINDAIDVNMTMKAKKPSKNGFPLLPAGVSIPNIDSAGDPGPPLQIVNGTETEGPVDSMVGLGSGAKGSTSNAPYCGGSLIAPRIVLTAAHCMSRQQVELYKVMVNMHDITNATGVETISLSGVRGEDIIVHHRYDPSTIQNDIALMILPKEVSGITYARINEDANVPSQAGDMLRVVGWGRTSYQGDQSNILLEAEVEYQMNEQCDDAYFGLNAVTDGMMCAAGEGIGVCHGDSGGPMMLASDESDPVQVGIVSWGYRCDYPDYPGVFTRVSSYADWIKEIACAFTGEFCPTCDDSQKLMKVIIHTDEFPGETTWEVTNICGKSSDPIMTGGPYPEKSRHATLVTIECVPDGEYEFNIKDSYGDGNCCRLGYGYYSFQYGDEEAIGGDFGFNETESLGSCTTLSPIPQPTYTPTHQVTSSPQPQPTNVTVTPTFEPSTVVSTTFQPTQFNPPTNAPTSTNVTTHQPTLIPTHQVTSAPQPQPKSVSPTFQPTQDPPPTNAPTSTNAPTTQPQPTSV